MRFVIDESSWNFGVLAENACIQTLESVLNGLEDAQSLGHETVYSEDLFHTPIWKDKCFYDLYEDDSEIVIPQHIRERIASLFYSLQKWQDLDFPWPDSFDVDMNGKIEFAPSITWAHKQVVALKSEGFACIGMSINRPSGCFQVIVGEVDQPIWFVCETSTYLPFFRAMILAHTTTPTQLESLVGSAFPQLEFVSGCFNGIKDMSRPYSALIPDIVCHLSAFSDHGRSIFDGPRDRVAAEFGPYGVDIFDENGNTKADRAAKKRRTIDVDGSDLIFWWHSKLERHRDRIHIYPEAQKIIVGIFCQHL